MPEYLRDVEDGQTVTSVNLAQRAAQSHLDLFFQLSHSFATTQFTSSKE